MSSTGLEPRTFILFILCRGVLAYAVAKRLYAVVFWPMPWSSGLFSCLLRIESIRHGINHGIKRREEKRSIRIGIRVRKTEFLALRGKKL